MKFSLLPYLSLAQSSSLTLPKILPSVLRLLMRSSSVVLPAPLGPMTAHMSPEKIVPVTYAAGVGGDGSKRDDGKRAPLSLHCNPLPEKISLDNEDSVCTARESERDRRARVFFTRVPPRAALCFRCRPSSSPVCSPPPRRATWHSRRRRTPPPPFCYRGCDARI